MKSRTILIAGGAGFVGSHLSEALIKQGNKVVVLDNLSTGNRKNIAHLLKHDRFKFVKGDVGKVFDIKADEIYHLASPASPPQYQKDPIGTFRANVIGCINLLEVAKKNKAKFLFASTSEVYGDPKQHPQTESYFGNVNPVGIRSCYDESKRMAETLCMDYFRQYGLPIKIVRIFNSYGPRMDKNDGRVVSNFIVQSLMGKPLTIYGQGRQTRSFQYVDDLILGLTKMMSSPKNFAGPVNLGNPKEITVLQLAKKILSLTKSKSPLAFKALPKDDPSRRKPDITLAKKALNWQPEVNLEMGLIKTINYFKAIV